jgi:hypothetical protein
VESQSLANLLLVYIGSPISGSSIAFQLALIDESVEVTGGYALFQRDFLDRTKFAQRGHIVPIPDTVVLN